VIKITVGEDPHEKFCHQELRDAKLRFDAMWNKEIKLYGWHKHREYKKRFAAYMQKVIISLNTTMLIEHGKMFDLSWYVSKSDFFKCNCKYK